MEVSYQRDMNHNYMILACDGNLDEESYETRMIFANKIRGLLPCHIRYVDGRTYLGYDVTSRQNLTVFCENRRPGRKEIRSILGSILETMSFMEEYLLDPDHLILDPQLVLMNFETREAVLAFAPFYRKDYRNSLRELTEYLLTFIAHDDQQGIVLMYRFSHELTETNSGITELLGILYEKKVGGGSFAGSLPDDRSPREGVSRFGSDEMFRDSDVYGPVDSGSGEKLSAEDAGTVMAGDGRCDKPPAGGPDPAGAPYEDTGGTGSDPVKSRKKSAVKRAALITGIGLLVIAAVYVGIHYILPAALLYRDMTLRIGAAILVCGAAVAAGIFFRKKGSSRIEVSELYPEHRDGIGELYPEHRDGVGELYPELRDVMGDSYSKIRGGDEMFGMEEAGEEPAHRADVTALLTGGSEGGLPAAVLIPEDPGAAFPTITLSDGEVLIGKQKGLVNCVVDSPAVSRIHARIRRGDDGYYLRDLNSTNGTSVNGEPVFGSEEVCLGAGDRVVLADVVYVMK